MPCYKCGSAFHEAAWCPTSSSSNGNNRNTWFTPAPKNTSHQKNTSFWTDLAEVIIKEQNRRDSLSDEEKAKEDKNAEELGKAVFYICAYAFVGMAIVGTVVNVFNYVADKAETLYSYATGLVDYYTEEHPSLGVTISSNGIVFVTENDIPTTAGAKSLNACENRFSSEMCFFQIQTVVDERLCVHITPFDDINNTFLSVTRNDTPNDINFAVEKCLGQAAENDNFSASNCEYNKIQSFCNFK